MSTFLTVYPKFLKGTVLIFFEIWNGLSLIFGFYRKALVATVPKLNFTTSTPVSPMPVPAERFTHAEMLSVTLKRDQIDQYTTQELVFPPAGSNTNTNVRLCHNQFCCEFQFTASSSVVPLDQVYK